MFCWPRKEPGEPGRGGQAILLFVDFAGDLTGDRAGQIRWILPARFDVDHDVAAHRQRPLAGLRQGRAVLTADTLVVAVSVPLTLATAPTVQWISGVSASAGEVS